MSSGGESADRQRWAELKSLFNGAIERPLDEWPSLVSRLREDDPDQADRLQRLLDGHRQELIQVERQEQHELAEGTAIGPYVVTGLIGEGGMGRVYRAHHARLGRDVAIKVLPPGLTHDKDRRLRMEREARAMGMLNHPNIVTVHDIGDHDGSPYIVSELLEGETLRERVSGDDGVGLRLEPDAAIEIVAAVADALGAAHARGIVHRDIKPENVFLTSAGRVKVLDFGIAKLLDGDGAGEGTATGAIIGTLGYITPEQLRGEPPRPETDVYACGVVLYELVQGVRPFAGPSQAALIGAILMQPPPALGSVAPAFAELVARCLAKAPEARFADGVALAAELRALHGAAALASDDPREHPTLRLGEGGGPAGARADRSDWRKRWIAMGAALLVASLAIGVWSLRMQDGASPVAPPTATGRPAPAPAPPTVGNAAPDAAEPRREPSPSPSLSVPAPARPVDERAPAPAPPGKPRLPDPVAPPPAPAPAPIAETPPAPVVLALDGIWTFEEHVSELDKGIDCTASGGLQLAGGDGVFDGTLRLKQACKTTQGDADALEDALALKAGAVAGDAVSFLTSALDDKGLATTCRYRGRLVGSTRGTMTGEVECDARQAGVREVLMLRGTWKATRTPR